MAIVDLFIGNHLNAVDAKGRVSLPAGFRTVVENRQLRTAPANSQNEPQKQVTFVYNERRGCLVGFDSTIAAMLLAARDARADPLAGGDLWALQDADRAALPGAVIVGYDPSGRMVLPDYLRDKAGIRDLAFFHGIQRTFELWNPDAYLAQQGPEDGPDQDQLAHLLRNRSRND